MKNDNKIKFPGFPPEREDGNFWCYPSVMDNFWCYLTGSEQKVLTFILRRTWGFNKNSDRISKSQFKNGVGNLDKGTGLSKKPVLRALKSLEDNKFIKIQRKKIVNEKLNETNIYHLVVSKVNNGSDKMSSGSGDKLVSSGGVKSTQTIDNNNTIDNNTIDQIYDSYSEHINEKSRLTSSAKKKIEARLKEYSPEDLKLAITNFSRSNWWMTHNAHRGVAWFFHSEDRIDQFLNLEPEDRKEKLRL